jgi:hypothetical protein
MSDGKTKLFLGFAILAFIVAALRFVPQVPISKDAADFAGGLGVGLLIAVLVVWGGSR